MQNPWEDILILIKDGILWSKDPIPGFVHAILSLQDFVIPPVCSQFPKE